MIAGAFITSKMPASETTASGIATRLT